MNLLIFLLVILLCVPGVLLITGWISTFSRNHAAADPLENWNTDKFYKGWIRFHIFAGIGMAALGVFNGTMLIINVAQHRPLVVLINMMGVGICAWTVYRTPGQLKDVRRRWASMVELERTTNEFVAMVEQAMKERDDAKTTLR